MRRMHQLWAAVAVAAAPMPSIASGHHQGSPLAMRRQRRPWKWNSNGGNTMTCSKADDGWGCSDWVASRWGQRVRGRYA
ncbi:Os06g0194101 [Oryza sativa Japonica Group]|uniref:Os06g0194101 protein n=1 Tax=Oryza sativa subsp. japonica TaxID=39947 RepID=A0A0P0WU45_ORYSJ|nr:Os06g0194101 [Oryza sativa Japonica Group]